MQDLIWALQSCGNAVHTSQDHSITFSAPTQAVDGWQQLIRRLNSALNNPYRLTTERHGDATTLHLALNNADPFAREKEMRLFSQAVTLHEHLTYSVNSTKTLDIKLGLSCNNNCIHCVIKPDLYRIKREHPERVVLDSGVGMQCHDDMSYEQIIDILKEQRGRYRFIVLTGGEPTVRKDLIQIIKWIYYNLPGTEVVMQTNGRALADLRLVKAIRRYTRHPSFTLALHGMEQTHNQIVNNRKDAGNPYQETVDGIRNLLAVFASEQRPFLRIEVVLSRANVAEMPQTIAMLYAIGVRNVGLSYPHLSGFAQTLVDQIAPPMADVLTTMRHLNTFVQIHPDCSIIFEEVPFCLYAQLQGSIRLLRFSSDVGEIDINFMANEISEENYRANQHHAFAKVESCGACALSSRCAGVWAESLTINRPSLVPVPAVSSELTRFLTENLR